MIFELSLNEDGDVYLHTYPSKESFLKSYNEEVKDCGDAFRPLKFKLPNEIKGMMALMSEGPCRILIEGNVIVPKAKTVVTEFGF